jgi:hypothetical protein
VRSGADHRGRLGFDQCLQDELDALADQIDVFAGAQHVEQCIGVKIKLGHRCDLLVVSVKGHVEIHIGGPLTGGPSVRFTPLHGAPTKTLNGCASHDLDTESQDNKRTCRSPRRVIIACAPVVRVHAND